LLLDKPIDPAIRELVPTQERYGGWIDRIGLWRAMAGCGILAAVVVVAGYSSPSLLAPYVPMSWERNFGDAILGDYGQYRCRNSEGQQALVALVERLDPGATAPGERQIDVAAVNLDMFNAAALPGNHIVVLKGAIQDDVKVDALAGIVAHEIAHVRRRHVTEAMIREMGIGALVGLFAPRVAGDAQQVLSLTYTREHEAEADADAIQMLERAGISPMPTAELFARFAKKDGEDGRFLSEFLKSHPLSAGRSRQFARAFRPGAKYRPALDAQQSSALMGVCSGI